jgi:hypothetical protein
MLIINDLSIFTQSPFVIRPERLKPWLRLINTISYVNCLKVPADKSAITTLPKIEKQNKKGGSISFLP